MQWLEEPCLRRHILAPERHLPLLPSPALWLRELPGPGWGDPATFAVGCAVGMLRQWIWFDTWQGSTQIGEDGWRGTCRAQWHCLACCPGPALSYMRCPTEHYIVHPPVGTSASHRLDHQSGGVGEVGREERLGNVCVCVCDTGSVSPRLCDRAGHEQCRV